MISSKQSTTSPWMLTSTKSWSIGSFKLNKRSFWKRRIILWQHWRNFLEVNQVSSRFLLFSDLSAWLKLLLAAWALDSSLKFRLRFLLWMERTGLPSCLLGIVVNDTQSDSIQYLNFAKKWFIQYSIQYCFTQDSIQNIIQFKINSGDSIQNIIQFNSQGMINTGRIGKVPKNWPKSVQNRQKRGLIIKNGKYRFKNWVIHSFHDKIQFKGLFNIIFSGIFNSKNYSIIFFPRKFNSKIYSKFLIWLDSIQ